MVSQLSAHVSSATDNSVSGRAAAVDAAANAAGAVARVAVFAPDKKTCDAAEVVVQELVCDITEGQIFKAAVKEVRDYVAVVQVLRGREGLLHMSGGTWSRRIVVTSTGCH